MADITVQGSIYDKVIFKPFAALKSEDLNTLQDSQNFFHQESNKYSVGDGPEGESWKVRVDDQNTATLIIQHGSFVHKGAILHLPNDISFDYTAEKSILSPSVRYVFFCEWEDTEFDSNDDPSLNDPRLGEVSTRSGHSFTFGIHQEFSPVQVSKNYIPLAVMTFTGSQGNLNDLTPGDIIDLRLNVAQHYVVDGFNFKESNPVGTNLEVTVDAGGLSYLGVFKRLNAIDDSADLTFSIPLPDVGTEARYRISYKLNSITISNPSIQKVISAVLPSSTVNGSVIDLFEFTLDSAGIVSGTIRDLRQYEPLSRRIPSNSKPPLADLSLLKPRQSATPGLTVIVESGWYFYRGDYNFSPETTVIHDSLPQRETSTFDTPSGAGILGGAGSYFTFSTPTTDYYAWYEIDNDGNPATSDPALVGRTGVRIDVNSADADTTVASKTAIDLATVTLINVYNSGVTVTITNNNPGNVTDLVDFNVGLTNINITNGGQHRKDVVGFNSSGSLILFKGEEVLDTITVPEPSTLTADIFVIYEVIINDTTSVITDPADPSSVQDGEIKDLRNILHHLMPSEKVNVDSSSFSGLASGGLASSPTDRDLQDVIQEVNDQLVNATSSITGLGIVPQDDSLNKASFTTSGDLTLGHEDYTGGNTDPSTKVGIGVVRDGTDPNKVVIKNLWDSEMHTLAGGGFVPDTMHFHAGAGGLENGSPILVTRPVVEERPQDRYALVSDFILAEVSNPTFELVPAAGNVPTHIALNVDPNGGIEVGPNGVAILIDTTRGITGNTLGIGVYLDSLLSGLEFQDDGGGDYFLKVKEGDGLQINGSGELEVGLDPLGGLNIVTDLIKVGNPSQFIDATRGLTGLGSAPNELIGVNLINPLDFNGSGQLYLRINDVGPGPAVPSFLTLENDTNGTNQFLRVNIDELSGLQENTGALAVNLNDGLEFDGSGAINVKTNSSFSFSGSGDLQFEASTLVDGTDGISETSGILGVIVDADSSLQVDNTLGVQVLVTDPLEHAGTGPSNIGLKLESSDPTLEVKTGDNNSLGVKLDPDGDLETGPSGIKVSSFVSLGDTALYIYGGVYSFPVSTISSTPTSSYAENVMNGYLTKYDYNFKNTTYLGAHTDANSLVHSHGSFIVNDGTDDIFNVVGGSTAVTLNTTLSHRIFNFTTETWSVGTTTNLDPWNEMASVKIDADEGAVIAGTNTVNAGSMSIYKATATVSWTNLNLPSVAGDLDGAAATLYDTNKILLAGGNDGSYQTTIYEIELAGVGGSRTINSMNTLLINLPVAKNHMASFSINPNEVFIVGGEEGTSTHADTISLISDLDTTPAISNTRFLPVFGRSRLAGDVINSEGVLVGGLTLNDAYTNDVIVYNPTSETFRIDSKLLTGLRNHTANTR